MRLALSTLSILGLTFVDVAQGQLPGTVYPNVNWGANSTSYRKWTEFFNVTHWGLDECMAITYPPECIPAFQTRCLRSTFIWATEMCDRHPECKGFQKVFAGSTFCGFASTYGTLEPSTSDLASWEKKDRSCTVPSLEEARVGCGPGLIMACDGTCVSEARYPEIGDRACYTNEIWNCYKYCCSGEDCECPAPPGPCRLPTRLAGTYDCNNLVISNFLTDAQVRDTFLDGTMCWTNYYNFNCTRFCCGANACDNCWPAVTSNPTTASRAPTTSAPTTSKPTSSAPTTLTPTPVPTTPLPTTLSPTRAPTRTPTVAPTACVPWTDAQLNVGCVTGRIRDCNGDCVINYRTVLVNGKTYLGGPNGNGVCDTATVLPYVTPHLNLNCQRLCCDMGECGTTCPGP